MKKVTIGIPEFSFICRLSKVKRILLFSLTVVLLSLVVILTVSHGFLSHSEILASEMYVEISSKNSVLINPTKVRTWNISKGSEVDYFLTITNVSSGPNTCRLDSSVVGESTVKLFIVGKDSESEFRKPGNLVLDSGGTIEIRICATPTRSSEVRFSVGILEGSEFKTRIASWWILEIK